MGVTLAIRNTTSFKGCYTKSALNDVAARVCSGEGVPGDVEVSVLLCDDALIRDLNSKFGGDDKATDVLSFEQSGFYLNDGPRPLGDIVISLETVHNRCAGDAAAMRHEVQLLFCHGLLHLIGFDHESAQARLTMIGKQAEYLQCARGAAWFGGH